MTTANPAVSPRFDCCDTNDKITTVITHSAHCNTADVISYLCGTNRLCISNVQISLDFTMRTLECSVDIKIMLIAHTEDKH